MNETVGVNLFQYPTFEGMTLKQKEFIAPYYALMEWLLCALLKDNTRRETAFLSGGLTDALCQRMEKGLSSMTEESFQEALSGTDGRKR